MEEKGTEAIVLDSQSEHMFLNREERKYRADVSCKFMGTAMKKFDLSKQDFINLHKYAMFRVNSFNFEEGGKTKKKR